MQNNLKYLKDLPSLKLHLNFNKNGIIKLKTISEATIAKVTSRNENGQLFKTLFLKLGFAINDIDFANFDFLNYDLNKTNEFLKNNNIDYYVNYLADINSNISFIEFKKIYKI